MKILWFVIKNIVEKCVFFIEKQIKQQLFFQKSKNVKNRNYIHLFFDKNRKTKLLKLKANTMEQMVLNATLGKCDKK